MYEVLLWLHVTFAALWVGGSVALTVLATMAQRSNDAARVQSVVTTAESFGSRYFGPIGMLAVLFGVGLVLEGPWSFGDAWIPASLGLVVVSILIGAVFLSRETARAREALAASAGAFTTESRAAVNRIIVASWIDAAILVAVIFLMTTKPGT